MIRSSVLPKGATPTLHTKKAFKTIAGNFLSSRTVSLSEIVLLEFDKTRKIDGITVYVFDEPCPYDIILGRDFMEKAGIDVLFSKGIITWLDRMIPMKTLNELNDVDTLLDDTGPELYASEILDAKYDETSIEEVVRQQTHLNEGQRRRLQETLDKYTTIFDGKLGHYTRSKVHLELEETAKPFHTRPYPVAKVHEAAFKKELDHLVSIGVLRPCTMTQWASLTLLFQRRTEEYDGYQIFDS